MPGFSLPSLVSCAAVLFAIALQIQITLFASGDYMGLRISAADFLIPLAGLGILLSLFLKRSQLPQWKKPFAWHFPALMTGIIIMAMVNGYLVQGGISQWALVNKFIGWFLLMAYFYAGGWLAANHHEKYIPLFIKSFCGFFIFTAGIEITDQFMRAQGVTLGPRADWETIRGFTGNRNAFAFLMCCVASITTLYGFHKNGISTKIMVLFWIAFPLAFLFNGSRTLWVCAAALLGIFTWMDWKKSVRCILPSILIGLFAFFIFSSEMQKKYFSFLPYNSINKLYNYMQTPEDPQAESLAFDTGDAGRMEIAKGAAQLIVKYPLQGAGLGSVLYFQEQKNAKTRNIIDNTGLWLLTETGIIGFGIFAASYIFMALALSRSARNFQNPENILPLAALLVMLCFGIFSLLHEILYTRFFWFILGMALALPRTRPQPPAP